MDYPNFTEDQKQAFWLILGLLTFAAVTYSGAWLLAAISPIISILLFGGGVFLTALAVTGYYVEFVEKAKD